MGRPDDWRVDQHGPRGPWIRRSRIARSVDPTSTPAWSLDPTITIRAVRGSRDHGPLGPWIRQSRPTWALDPTITTHLVPGSDDHGPRGPWTRSLRPMNLTITIHDRHGTRLTQTEPPARWQPVRLVTARSATSARRPDHRTQTPDDLDGAARCGVLRPSPGERRAPAAWYAGAGRYPHCGVCRCWVTHHTFVGAELWWFIVTPRRKLYMGAIASGTLPGTIMEEPYWGIVSAATKKKKHTVEARLMENTDKPCVSTHLKRLFEHQAIGKETGPQECSQDPLRQHGKESLIALRSDCEVSASKIIIYTVLLLRHSPLRHLSTFPPK